MNLRLRALGILCVGLTGASLSAGPQAKTDVQRIVYVTATDQSGVHVPDLAGADFTVKEGGKDRQILSVAPSEARLKIALAIDELLSADVLLRQAALRFIQQLHESGDVALFLVGRRNEKRVDYTSDLARFISALNAFPTRPQYPGNLVESLFEIAKDQRALEGRRVIVTLASDTPQASTVTANGVLDQLRDNSAVLYAVTIVGLTSGGTFQESPPTRLEGGDLTAHVERERVLNDGPKQSGGLGLPSVRVEGFPAALGRIVGDLRNQHVVSYVMPAGSKSDGRLNIAVKRKGLTVRGPTRLPPL